MNTLLLKMLGTHDLTTASDLLVTIGSGLMFLFLIIAVAALIHTIMQIF